MARRTSFKYALREPETNRYWNLVIPSYRHSRKTWMPSFSRVTADGSPPQSMLATRDRAERAAVVYEALRRARPPKNHFYVMPELEMVCFQKANWAVVGSEPLFAPEHLVRAEEFSYAFGQQFAKSYLDLHNAGVDPDRFPVAFRRSGRAGEKREMENRFPGVMINGPIVWLESEADLVAFKLAFNESFGRIYYVERLEKSRNRN